MMFRFSCDTLLCAGRNYLWEEFPRWSSSDHQEGVMIDSKMDCIVDKHMHQIAAVATLTYMMFVYTIECPHQRLSGIFKDIQSS